MSLTHRVRSGNFRASCIARRRMSFRCNRVAPALQRWSGVWGTRSPAASSCPIEPSFVSLAVKPVGKPDAGNPHVRFDERGWETGRRFGVSARAHPRLYKLTVGKFDSGKFPVSPFFCRYRTKQRFNALLRRPATQERHIAVFCHDGCRKGSVNRTAGFLVAGKTAFVQSAELAAQTLIVHGREYSQLIPV